ncbi:MAG: endolytic transglycosylase MltG [Anaerolineae bacterium]|nr:endolytic transglycosylase MltG [Anaerolineae bacterium]
MGHVSSRYRIGAVVALGLLAWVVVAGIILLDSPPPVTTPTTMRIVVRNTIVPTVSPALTSPPLPTATASATAIPSTVVPPTYTAVPATISAAPTFVATANGCPPPQGWIAYTIDPGDTLFGFELGSKGQVKVADIMAANCLKSTLLTLGQVIYLPPGVADNAPKVDDGPAAPAGNAGNQLTRTANCPCSITVRPGWRLEQIAAAVDSTVVGFSGRDFMAAVGPGALVPDLEFLRSKPAGKSLEGFMFPGTYNLENSTTAVQFRDMLLSAFDAAVDGKMRADSAARGRSFWEIIVIASIIQRESYALHEQRLIASVFYNRLAANKGIQATVTLQYALGRPGNWWPRIVGNTINTDSPYNTNLYAGLPPSAISNPSLDAIRAAVYPEQTEYQYFSAKCEGGGNFYAKTYEEFKQGLACDK